MQSTKLHLLRNPDIQPTRDVLAEALGVANNAFVDFVSELECHDIQMEWRYYNDGKAWLAKGIHKWTGARGGQKEVTVFWLSIWESFFKITIYLPEKSRADIAALPLGDAVIQLNEHSPQMGKLKFYPIVFDVSSDELLETIYMIIDYKKGQNNAYQK